MLIIHFLIPSPLCTGPYHLEIGQLELKPECKSLSNMLLVKKTMSAAVQMNLINHYVLPFTFFPRYSWPLLSISRRQLSNRRYSICCLTSNRASFEMDHVMNELNVDFDSFFFLRYLRNLRFCVSPHCPCCLSHTLQPWWGIHNNTFTLSVF